jgi:hypothetical protein
MTGRATLKRREWWSASTRAFVALTGTFLVVLVPVRIASAAPNENPFVDSALANFLSTRTSDITAGLYNPATGETYLYRPNITEVTASMAKMDILADLLYESQETDKPLTAKVQALATKMIELSDNTAAQTLYVKIGQLPGITTFNQKVGFTQTVESWDWGQIATDPRDQLHLLRTILLPNALLTPASQAYEQNLMQHVVGYERWGIPTGPPATAVVGNKNGWYPETKTGWQINSAGYVRSGHTYYLAVFMSAHNSSEDYGIDTLNTASALLWHFESTHAT